MAAWIVADFEAFSYQIAITFETSNIARTGIALEIDYTAYWQLVKLYSFNFFFINSTISFIAIVASLNIGDNKG